MKETYLKIPIPNTTLEIHGVLRGSFSSPLVILAPGLGGWMNDLLLFNASRYFEKQGISSLRVSFYGNDEKQRDIKDFDVNIAASDIDTLVDFAKQQGAKWLGAVGHSYSGMAIVYSRAQKFDTAVLWDPSHTYSYATRKTKNNFQQDFIYIKKLDSYVSGKGQGYVLSKKVFENYAPGSKSKARDFKVPTLIVNAVFSKEMQGYGEDYATSINAPTERTVIPNSTHPFIEDGVMEQLFEKTYEWINKQLINFDNASY